MRVAHRGQASRSLAATLALAAALLATAVSVFAPIPAAAQDARLQAAVAAEQARPRAPRFPRADFLLRPSRTSVVSSPDGLQVAWLQDDGRTREVWLQDTRGGRARRMLANAGAESLGWTRDSRWLLVATRRHLSALAMSAQGGSGIVTTLGGTEQRRVFGVDVTQPAAVMLLERGPDPGAESAKSWRLVRARPGGGREMVWEDVHRITGATLDPQGRLAWLQRVEGVELVIHHMTPAGPQAVARCGALDRCATLGSAPDGSLWMRSDLQGDLTRVVKVDATGHLTVEHQDPRGLEDIADVVLDPVTGQPRFASVRGTSMSIRALKASDAEHLAVIQRSLPGRDLWLQPAVDGGRWLVRETFSTLQAARWHLYDPEARRLSPLFDSVLFDPRSGTTRAALPDAAMARALPVSWPASDGLRLHGLLWLPPGEDPSRVPLVVHVHGGPWNHVAAEFRRLPQWLANRGYAVFEPNFRASTGYGRSYVLSAAGDFGNGRVQRDIVEGTQWVLRQGIGEPDRVGIVGGSFGGYSTLLALTFQPELFKVGVALMPPPDFAWTLRWILRNPESIDLANGVPMQELLRALSLDLADGKRVARLEAESPLRNAARMDRPLLLVAGGEDQRVGIAGVLEYAAALKRDGKDVSLLVDDAAGHSGGDAVSREAETFAMETLLHTHLGGAAPAPPDEAVRDFLRRNLRLRGATLRE